MTQPVGILLTNLGTPDAPTPKALKTYLREFLSDPRVVEVPRLLWWFILNVIILNIRPRRSAKAYAKIWQNTGSPLLSGSQSLAEALQLRLNQNATGGYSVKLGMRYGNPTIGQQLDDFMAEGITRVLVVPLYPQYSATTTASTVDAIHHWIKQQRAIPEFRYINDYSEHPRYIEAIANSISHYCKQHGAPDKVLFSYHGIPQRYANQGDPYPTRCEITTRLVTEHLSLEQPAYQHCYQSRFGTEPWLQPYTDKFLESAPTNGISTIYALCPGFSIDCLETLEEMAIENRDVFLTAGGTSYHYIPCLNDTPDHVDVMEQLVKEHTLGW